MALVMLQYGRECTEGEIVEGLALFLDPDTLHSYRFSWIDVWNRIRRLGPDCRLVQGNHYFVVIGRSGDRVALVPAYSDAKPYRIPVLAKTGDPRWVRHSTNVDLHQVWMVPPEAVVAAAHAAGDGSDRGCRNRVEPEVVREIREHIAKHCNRKETRDETATAA
jgi:hypothetical protein